MDVLTPALTGAMLALFTVIITWINKGRFDALQRQIDQLRTEVRSEMASLRIELGGEIASLRREPGGEIGSVRSDLFQVVLRLGLEPRPNTG